MYIKDYYETFKMLLPDEKVPFIEQMRRDQKDYDIDWDINWDNLIEAHLTNYWPQKRAKKVAA